MKKIIIGLTTGLSLFCAAGVAHAALTPIGTATYNGADYKLIWDDDNNGNSVVWLDYKNGVDTWANQNAWAAGLDGALSINLAPGYSIAWNDAAWRLPAKVDGLYQIGYDGTTTAGFNITSSEMGHLFYVELGNLGYYDTTGTLTGWNWTNMTTGVFDNFAWRTWSGTEYALNPDRAWYFFLGQEETFPKDNDLLDGFCPGMAVRSGEVSAVPLPGALWLLGSGLAGLIAAPKRKK